MDTENDNNDTETPDDEQSKGVDHYIVELNLDAETLPATSPEMQHERRVAIFDLLEENHFRPAGSLAGPYVIDISLKEGDRLQLDIQRSNGSDKRQVMLSVKPLRRVIKDYFLICESYHNAIRTATSAQIEAIDMGRRGLHNEGSRMLTDGLRNKVEIEFTTARRLFVLLCSLHRRP